MALGIITRNLKFHTESKDDGAEPDATEKIEWKGRVLDKRVVDALVQLADYVEEAD